MRKTLKIAIPLVLFIMYIAGLLVSQPQNTSYGNIKNGEIYISDEDFYKDSKIFLTGEWEFYFGELLNPQDFENKAVKKVRILPDYWQRDWNDRSVETNGFGTYRLLINFETPKKVVALDMPWIFGAYEMIVNGETVLKCGTVGMTPETEAADVRSQVASVPINSDKMEIVIKVSGYISGLSGLLHPIAISDYTTIVKHNSWEVTQDALFIGCFFIMGFYHLVLFFLRKKDKATFSFAILCFIALIRQGALSYGFLFNLLPKNNGLFAYDIYIISTMWLMALLPIFSYYLFGKQYNFGKKSIILIISLCVIKTVHELFWKYNFSWVGFWLAYACYIPIIIYLFRILFALNKHKAKHRYIYIYGILFLMLGNLSDVLVDFGFTNTGVFGDTAFVIFLFIEAIILANIYAGYSYENERLLANMEMLVEERTNELAKANEQLLLSEKTKNELTSNISHDLKTPLTAIRGYMELLMADSAIDESHKAYIESAYVRTNQMEKLIPDLFLLTRITERRLPLDITAIDADVFMQECYQSYVPIAEEKGINLILEITSEGDTILADKARLMQIMDNLMQNALAYTKTKIIISAKEDGGKLTISVIDDGIGIEAEYMQNIFERFYKGRKGGTGLGLCIVKELVTAMGGEVLVQSTPYVKTEFSVSLRLAGVAQC